MAINVANSLLCYPLRSSTSLFLICIETNYLVIAGVFAIFPVPVSKTFGPRFGTAVYAMVLIGSPLSALLITFQNHIVAEAVGMQGMFACSAIFSGIAIVVAFFFNEKLDIERLHKKQLLEFRSGDNPVEVKEIIKPSNNAQEKFGNL